MRNTKYENPIFHEQPGKILSPDLDHSPYPYQGMVSKTLLSNNYYGLDQVESTLTV